MVMIQDIWRLLLPILVFIGFVIAGYALRIFLNVYLTGLAKKTKTKVDEIIIDAVKTPIVVIFLLAGVNFALGLADFVPAQVTQYLPTVFSVVIILIATLAIGRAIKGILIYYGLTRPNLKSLVPLLSKISKFLIYFIALVLILRSLGIDVTALVAGLGIAGIAIAFALQETLSQFFSGLYIMTDRPVRIGDYIELESGQKGYVVDVGWRSTRIRELPNNIIIIPNTKLAGARITNFYLPDKETACLVQVGVSYNSDLEKVERVTIEVGREAIKRVEGEMPGFDPFIRYHTFSDFSINFTVILRVKEYVDKFLLTHEFIKALHKRYKKEGIVIPFPIRTVYMKREH